MDTQQLMRRAAQGDQLAFGTLARLLWPALYTLAWRILDDASLAEDAVQEALVKLWQTAPRWQPRAQVETYAYRLTYTACMDVLRRRKKTRAEPLPAEGLHDQQPSALQRLGQQQVSAQLHAALHRLPAKQRTAVVMAYFMELPQQEIAHSMHTSVRAVEGLLARARKELRRTLPADATQEML